MSETILIGDLEKNSMEKLRVQISHYKGSTFLDARVYFQDDGGEYRPTKKGITLRKEDIRPFMELLQRGEKKL